MNNVSKLKGLKKTNLIYNKSGMKKRVYVKEGGQRNTFFILFRKSDGQIIRSIISSKECIKINY